MNKIEKMLQELCPNGVEWKELGEVCEFNRGQALTSKNAVLGDVPVISGGQKPAFMHNVSNRQGETVVVAGSGAYAGFVSYWNKPIFVSDAFSVDIKNGLELKPRYVFHFLLNNQHKIYATKSGAGIPHVYGKNLARFKIPVPPLEIQEKIVQILDKFTEYVTKLISELTSELTLRQKQYSYYRDKLLSFEDEVYQVKWKLLKEVAKLKNGKDWKNLSNGDVPVYGSGGEMGEYVSEYAYDKPTVLIPRKGSISNLFYLEKPFWNVDTIYYTEIDESQIVPRYLYYYLTTIDFKSMAINPTRPSLTQAILDKIELPLPSLEIQKRIVHVLDNFDTVCNDLNIGLPKEIELRQKQYEYFREKLLTYLAEGEYHEDRIGEGNPSTLILLQWVFGTVRTTLGSVAKVQRGASPRPISQYITEKGGIPWIKIGDTSIISKYVYGTKQNITNEGANKSRVLKPGDFILSNSMSYGRPYILSIEGAIHDGWAAISDFESYIVSDFLYHYLISNTVQRYWEGKLNSGSVSNLNSDIINSLPITLPSLEKQAVIVEILDKFNVLTNSIAEGLLKEIQQRQQQYEYWREQLLKF